MLTYQPSTHWSKKEKEKGEEEERNEELKCIK